MIPELLRKDVESALPARVVSASSLGGGCISNATHLKLADSSHFFLKWGSEPDLFHAEASALEAIQRTRTVRVPRIVAISDLRNDNFQWLLLEWLEPGRVTPAGWEALGQRLSALHRTTHEAFGWPHANFIGSLPQSNAWHGDWPAFWRDQRVLPQLKRAGDAGALNEKDRRRIEKMLAVVDELAGGGNEDGPSLLHGDLWGGNVHGRMDGSAAVIDPSIYYGHREVDLAMATLFGGFDRRFFDAYATAWPWLPGWEQRRHLYQLYYLLVHVNLFGGSYRAGTMQAVGKLGF